MFNLTVKSAARDYRIVSDYDAGLFDFKNYLILKDEYVALPNKLINTSRLISLGGDEALKTLDAAQDLIHEFAKLGVDKQTKIVAIGGGTIQDIATFVCSIYMRGLDWIYVPTTLMAMADSCIGGKSSINVGSVKNLVGNFYPPSSIIIDSSFLTTLSREAIVSGLFEAVKISYAYDPTQLGNFSLLVRSWVVTKDDSQILSLIFKTLENKKWFIEIDEFDRQERKLLNFGHSFGHALESACNMKIPHGIAVGLGMQCAMEYSGQIQPELDAFIFKLLKWCEFDPDKLDFKSNVFIESISRDKKNSLGKQRLILLDSLGKLYLSESDLNPVFLEKQCQLMVQLLERYK